MNILYFTQIWYSFKKSEHKTSKLSLQSRKATASFKNGAASPKYPYGKKVNLTPTSYDIHKIQFQVDFWSVKINTMKLLEHTI